MQCACLGTFRAIGLLARESDSQIAVNQFNTPLLRTEHLEGRRSAARALAIKRECFQWRSGVESWTDTKQPQHIPKRARLGVGRKEGWRGQSGRRLAACGWAWESRGTFVQLNKDEKVIGTNRTIIDIELTSFTILIQWAVRPYYLLIYIT